MGLSLGDTRDNPLANPDNRFLPKHNNQLHEIRGLHIGRFVFCCSWFSTIRARRVYASILPLYADERNFQLAVLTAQTASGGHYSSEFAETHLVDQTESD